MKTNFLYFRENGYQKYTATAAQVAFPINGDANWDIDITDDTEVKVSVTALAAGTDNVGTSYLADGDAVAGTTYVLDSTDGYSYTGDVITIANTTGSATKGYDIEVGDIVTIELIPVAYTEACLRADKLRSVHSNSDTATEVTFEASNGSPSANDTVVLSHADDDGVAFKKIAAYFQSAAAGSFKSRGGVTVAWDKQNVTNGELEAAGVTKMLLAIA